MTQYDPGTIRDYADQLYVRANWMIGECATGGALLGAAGGGFVGYLVGTDPSRMSSAVFAALAGGALLGGLFYLVGKQKALQLKAQAQQMLCWLTIEANTRPEEEDRAVRAEPPPLARDRNRDLDR